MNHIKDLAAFVMMLFTIGCFYAGLYLLHIMLK